MVKTYKQLFKYAQPFPLMLGGSLPGFQLAYETWGQLNDQASNAILLLTGLSASSHAKSHGRDDVPGWWEAMIGPGAALDTDRFFIICPNHLGGCFGSTGPSSIRPNTDQRWGPEFPPLLLQDIVIATEQLIQSLGIERLYCVMGASMGGMLAMEYAARFNREADRMMMISGSGRPGPQSIAYRYVQRQVILNDAAFHAGWYYDQPEKPLNSVAVARQIGNITYRSREEFNRRFGRTRTEKGYSFGPDFQVESYLHHMGHKLASNFDPNSFLLLSKAMDLFSLGYEFASYEEGVARIRARTSIIAVSTDMLFPWDEQEEVHQILSSFGRPSQYSLIETPAGHDAFLVEVDAMREVISTFLEEQPLD